MLLPFRLLLLLGLLLSAASAYGQQAAPEAPDMDAAMSQNAGAVDQSAMGDAVPGGRVGQEPASTQRAAAEAPQPPDGMMVWPWRLWQYFGIWGGISILAWLAVLVLAVRFALRHEAGATFAIAAMLSLLVLLMAVGSHYGGDFALWGFVLLLGCMLVLLAGLTPLQWPVVLLVLVAIVAGSVNSSNVSAIEVDRSAIIEAQLKARAEAERAAELNRRRTTVSERFATAEMSAEDKRLLEEAGRGESETYDVSRFDRSAKRRSVSADAEVRDDASAGFQAGGEDDSRYAYRQQGKQQRDPDATAGAEGGSDGGAGASMTADVQQARVMLEADVVRANQWDRWNLMLVRWTPWLALLMVLVDYLHRFNRTVGTRTPLPIANRVIDALFPKTRTVLFRTDTDALRRYLETAVSKREDFIYFGPTDPWPDATGIARLRLLNFSAGGDRAPGGLNVWPLPKLVVPGGEVPRRAEFIFESAWFGRMCFVIQTADNPDAGEPALLAMIEHLKVRKIPRAATRRTVHLVWDVQQPLTAERLDQLNWLCREANFKLVVRTTEPLSDPLRQFFDEIVEPGQRVDGEPVAQPLRPGRALA